MDPIPDDLRPFYQGGYQTIPNNISELRVISATETYRMDPILRHKSGGSLLDIGPWMGIFACNAVDAGFKVTAIEIDENCVAFLKQTVGVSAIHSADPAATMDQMTETFDVITLWHSLEHLRDPWAVVQSAARRLAPGGILLIAIPNIESLEFKIFKGRWKHVDAPRHLYFYPHESLSRLCRESGLVPLEMTTTDKLTNALSYDVWFSWARPIQIRYVRGVLARVGFYLTRLLTKLTQTGSGITAVFQRPL